MTPAANAKINPAQPGLSPWKVIQTYESGEWEEFIAEWMGGFNPPYHQVCRCGGAGDKGRDVIGYLGDPTLPATEWDSYQCKHYRNALTPTNIYCELGKLCVYTWRGDYTVPRRYRFVAPLGVGMKLHDLLRKPDEMKKDLIANWDAYCRDKISSAESFPLEGKLKTYVNAFDFSIVWFMAPNEILDQHRNTHHWHRRFRVEPPVREDAPDPPSVIEDREQQYVRCLLNVYGERLRKPVETVTDIECAPMLHNHFKRARGHFYSAEALSRFSREQFTQGQGAFDGVKDHVLAGVEPVSLATHKDSFECVLAVTQHAGSLRLPASDLEPYVNPSDRIGLCHHLVNEDKLSWSAHARTTETI